MSINQLKGRIPDFAKEVRLNLASMMADETLSPQSKYGLLLASAIATRNSIVTAAMEAAAGVVMTPAAVEAAKSAASVMAMNNVCRFCSFHPNSEYKTMAARLRTNWLGNPRVDRSDFEPWALAVSAIKWWMLAWMPMRSRCGNPTSARMQFKGPRALPLSCSQLRVRSGRQGMTRRKWRSNSLFPQPFAPLFSGQARVELSLRRAPFRSNIRALVGFRPLARTQATTK